MLFLAIGNGALRDMGYKKMLGERAAHQVSTISLILLFAVYIRWAMSRFPPESTRQAVYVGLLWLIMTLVLETGMGLKQGKTGQQLLADYNVFRGRIWILIPLWVATAPVLFYTLYH